MNTETVERRFIELMNPHFTVQCKCGQCGRKQAIKVSDLAAGFNQCRITRLGQPPCNGTVEYMSEDPEEAMTNAIHLLGYINLINLAGKNSNLSVLIDTVVDDVGNWSERYATPQEMGWVGSDGLP